jgi:predicted ester cyclase
MPVDMNKAIVMRFYHEVINNKRLAALDRHFDESFLDNSPPLPGMPVPGDLGSFKRTICRLIAAFPDVHFVCEDVIAEADRVTVRFTASGTYRGPYKGISPTGRKVTWTGVHIFRLANGKVTEWWSSVDRLAIMRQLTSEPYVESGGAALMPL